jgi:ADP-dependent NAD(P)H-hydrate dehydratase / NAD(P)H-hydrate epimerase
VIPILDSRRMRAADAAAIRAGTPSEVLMENAAAGLCAELRYAHPGWRRVVVLCGPGNNGGDGLAAARLLALSGVAPSVFTLRDPEAYEGDPAVNASRLRAVGVSMAPLTDRRGFGALSRSLAECDGVVDALFGTGLSRALTGAARRTVLRTNASGKAVVSADVPSGLPADGGALLGPAVRAERTVAFGAPKPCHVLTPASGYCGRLAVVDIGIPRGMLEARGIREFLVEKSDVLALLPPRAVESNKGDFGRVAIIAGSRGKAGAAALAARAAIRGGAGLVTVFCVESIATHLLASLPEAMTEPLPESGGAIAASAAGPLRSALARFDAAVVGPGLGTSRETIRFLEDVIAGTRLPMLVDADGLNAFAGRPAFFRRRRGPLVLTPHPGEAGRLLGKTAKAVQEDRFGAARRLARSSRSVTLLKGARTLVAEPDGRLTANPTGTPLMATGGSGDVLSGLIGALLGGGLSPAEAAYAGAWLHGAAGEALEAALGDAGLLAHELADAVPAARRDLRRPPADE